ncbi:MAG: phosphatase [Actinomycetota bacterium]
MDVIEAHARRLPALDERWTPRPYLRAELERALDDGRVSGAASHPLDNVRGNIRSLLDGDPDKEFGLRGLQDGITFDAVLALVDRAAAAGIDPGHEFGEVHIAPGPILDACEALGMRLAAGAARGERMLFATGHPGGLDLLYRALEDLAVAHGAIAIRPADGERWREPHLPHPWGIGYLSSVGMLTDGNVPRHTHSPDAMGRMLAKDRPDLVLADHGFAGAAIEAGVETVSVADVNDPALLVAKAQGRTDVVVVMDDHVAPQDYWPCFQAAAAVFPQVNGPAGSQGYPDGRPSPTIRPS